MRVRLLVHGRVQGVGYRYSAREAASGLGLTGWVRNRYDGTVEAEAQGEPDAVQRFIKWCEEGSSWARVTGVDITDLPDVDDDANFVVVS